MISVDGHVLRPESASTPPSDWGVVAPSGGLSAGPRSLSGGSASNVASCGFVVVDEHPAAARNPASAVILAPPNNFLTICLSSARAALFVEGRCFVESKLSKLRDPPAS